MFFSREASQSDLSLAVRALAAINLRRRVGLARVRVYPREAIGAGVLTAALGSGSQLVELFENFGFEQKELHVIPFAEPEHFIKTTDAAAFAGCDHAPLKGRVGTLDQIAWLELENILSGGHS